jgi:3-polyprenyl-4-hydroxybenzoate decarboxylase
MNSNNNNTNLVLLLIMLVEEVEDGVGVGVVMLELLVVVVVAAEAEVVVEDVMEVAATEDETEAEEGVEEEPHLLAIANLNDQHIQCRFFSGDYLLQPAATLQCSVTATSNIVHGIH